MLLLLLLFDNESYYNHFNDRNILGFTIELQYKIKILSIKTL